MSKKMTVGRYLIARLRQAGARHVFGIPGDYVLGFYDLIVEGPLKHVGACAEQGAAFAADAYARVNGLGVVCVTYAVGGFNTVNAVAGAYAEKSPVVVISGAPGMGERARSPLLHHRVRDFNTQREVFELITAAAVSIEDPRRAPAQIDEVLRACLAQKRPVFIELPRDVVDLPCAAPVGSLDEPNAAGDPETLAEAVAETVAMLNAAKHPAILVGVEAHRFNLQDAALRLVEKTGFPVAATLLGKSALAENHPQYVGVYEGAMGRDATRKVIEDADCLLILGAFMTDINLGGFTAKLDPARTINANSERIVIKRHEYLGLNPRDFIHGLTDAPIKHAGRAIARPPQPKEFTAKRAEPVTVRRLFERVNTLLDDDMIVICDIGDSLFGAVDLVIHRRTEFISPAYYTSMGFAVPAALGAQTARPELRPIVFVGDGAFQMTGQELSSIARQGGNPIILILNNKGYTTERFIHEGPYNDIQDWAYHRLPDVLNSGWGAEARTEGELEDALQLALKNTKGFSIINIHLAKLDCSEALSRLCGRLSRQAGLAPEERTEGSRADQVANGHSAAMAAGGRGRSKH